MTMALEMTRNRMKLLGEHIGEITIEGEHQNEIVARIHFGNRDSAGYAAEKVYNSLLDIIDDRCESCGRYCPEGLSDGLCEDCWN
jgi:hypothetical protein